jgi:glycosyltransferase involved in cell wall biosynthesis
MSMAARWRGWPRNVLEGDLSRASASGWTGRAPAAGASPQTGVRRVLVTTSTLPRWPDDPEPRFVLDLARHLPPRWQPTILAPADPGAVAGEHLEGVRVVRYRYAPVERWQQLAYPGAILPRLRAHRSLAPLVPMLLLGLGGGIRRMLRSEHFDLVHSHWLIPQGLIQAFAFRRSGNPPYVVTSHGGDLHSFDRRGSRWLLRAVIRRSSAFTLVSRDLMHTADGFLPAGLSQGTLIPMGVDRAHFSPDKREPGLFRALAKAGPILLFVGRISEKKGLRYLIDAMADRRLERQDACLLVVGDGPLRTELEARAAAMGLCERVRFLGAIPHSRLAGYYASADLVCAPAVVGADGDKDGLPTVILEACASGTPCVSTPVGGIPDLLVDGRNARLAPPGNADGLARVLAELLADPAQLRRLGRAARAASEPFGWDRIASRYAEVYDRAMGASACGSA